MNSGKVMAPTSEFGGKRISDTSSIALLNRGLGTAPAPRALTPYEIGLLRRCAKEASTVAGEVLAILDGRSKA